MVNINEPVETGRAVQFEVNVADLPLPALHAEPFRALRERYCQVHQQKTFSGFAWSGNQHFVARPENARNQLISQRRRIAPHIGQQHAFRKIVRLLLPPVHPFLIGFFADVPRDDVLVSDSALRTWYPAEPARVFVLRIRLEPGLFRVLIQIVNALPVLLGVLRVDPDDGVQALSAGVNDERARQVH